MVQVRTERAIEGLRLLHAGIIQAAELTLKSAMTVAVESARETQLFKDKSGETRRSIQAVRRGGLHGFVRAGHAAHFLEYGTHPHTITAKRATTLRFVVAGQVFFRRTVRHPGTRARPFMHIARDKAERAVEHGAEIFIGEAIRRVHA